MIDLATEKEHLAKADRDVADGERRVAKQCELIEQMRGRAGPQDLPAAERLLQTLQETLQAWRDHRAIIVRTIADVEAGLLASAPAPRLPAGQA